MTFSLQSRIAAAVLLLSSVGGAVAEGGFPSDNRFCSAAKPFREMAQDETATISELCARFGTDREVAQEERPAAKINLTMEQRHIIKEIVLKDLKPKKATTALPLAVGDAVPSGVEVQPFPAEISEKVPQVSSHTFFVKDDQVIVVSPKDNKISDVIE
jgi:Protein of unknown function (DUF1236)